jgi:deazaflavin-dependent oxidoreductase (nitroreductase family)
VTAAAAGVPAWLPTHVPPVVRALARTPLHRMLGSRLLVLTYTGRRTGRTYELPVMAAPPGDDLVVVAGWHEGKSWWRNFGEEPREVTVRVGGRRRPFTARRLAPDDGRYREAVDAYLRTFGVADLPAGTPVLLLRTAAVLPEDRGGR